MTKSNTPTKSKNRSSLFRIHVRPDLLPTQARIGRVRDDQFIQESYEVQVNTPLQYIPNYYEARVVKTLDANGVYRGQFKFLSELKSGEAEKSEVVQIPIRYVKGTSSLDEKWQNDNGFKPRTDEEKIGWSLQSGRVTEWDKSKIDDHFVRFIINHEGNGNNPSRDKQSSVLFVVVDDAPVKDKMLEQVKLERELMQFKESILSEENVDSLRSIGRVLKIEGAAKYGIDTLKVELIKKLTTESYNSFVKEAAAFDAYIQDRLDTGKWERINDDVVEDEVVVMPYDSHAECMNNESKFFETISQNFDIFDNVFTKFYLKTKKIK